MLHLAGQIQLVFQQNKLVPGLEGIAQQAEMLQGTVDCSPQVVEVDGLRHEVEGTPVHRRTDVFHVTICRHNNRSDIRVHLGYLLEKRKTIHLGHVDIGEHHVDLRIAVELLKGLNPVAGKHEGVLARANLPAHALAHQVLKVGFVVHNEDLVGLFRVHELAFKLPRTESYHYPRGLAKVLARRPHRCQHRAAALTPP